MTSAEVDELQAPTTIAKLPGDLENPNLVYSGIAEDGWLTAEAYARLAGGPAATLELHAEVPPGRGRRGSACS